MVTAATGNQINAIVPAVNLDGPYPIDVVVVVDGVASAVAYLSGAATAPALYSVNGAGNGQGAILNQDGSVNGVGSPASAGSVISMYGTGAGLMTPYLPDGALVLSTPLPLPFADVSVTVAGKNADVLYAGAAPGLVTGVLQVNVRVPADAKAGNLPVVLAIGGVASTQEITVAVR